MSDSRENTFDPRRHAPATLRNRAAILEALHTILPAAGTVLEIASGTGEHAAFFAPRLGPSLTWQPSDVEADALASIDAHAADSNCPRIAPALRLDVTAPDWPVERADAILCCNMIHIAPWAVAEGLLAGAGRILNAGAPLILYGPFRRDGRHTAESNAAFDRSLRDRDPSWGVRDLDREVIPEAARHGLAFGSILDMPANNLIAVFRRH